MAKTRQKRLIALNLKTYDEATGEKGLKLCEIAAEVAMLSGVRIIVCPDATLLRESVKIGAETFAQAAEGYAPGAHTGWLGAHALKSAGVTGSMINHSEHRIPHEQVKLAVDALRAADLESMVCSKDVIESAQLASFKPNFIAVEPPELIGSGISVSNAKPDIVTGAVEAVRETTKGVGLICGAGITTPEDVKKAFELGADGVLLASAFVKAKNPRKLLEEMAAQA